MRDGTETSLGPVPVTLDEKYSDMLWGAPFKYWLPALLLDLGGVAGFGYWYQTTDGSKVLPITGMAVLGLSAILSTIIWVDTRRYEVREEQYGLTAQFPGHATARRTLRVPTDASVLLKLVPGTPEYTADQLRGRPVQKRNVGEMLVLDSKVEGDVSDADRRAITDVIIAELQRFNLDQMLGLQDVAAMLQGEKLKDLAGCDDVACATELGGALGKRYLVASSVVAAPSGTVLTIRVIDTQQSMVKARALYELGNIRGNAARGLWGGTPGGLRPRRALGRPASGPLRPSFAVPRGARGAA